MSISPLPFTCIERRRSGFVPIVFGSLTRQVGTLPRNDAYGACLAAALRWQQRGALGAHMSFDLSHQIDACKRRIGLVQTFVEEAEARGEMTSDAERQIILETELLRMLEAQF